MKVLAWARGAERLDEAQRGAGGWRTEMNKEAGPRVEAEAHASTDTPIAN